MAKQNTFSKYRRSLENYGIDPNRYLELIPDMNIVDSIHTMFKEAIEKNKKDDFTLSMIEFHYAWFNKDLGLDWTESLRQSEKYRIKHFMQYDSNKQLEVLIDPDPCRHCKSLKGKVFDIKEALANPPYPVSSCNNSKGFCRSTLLVMS